MENNNHHPDLQENAARLRAILETTVDGMITINEKAIIQSFNKAAERIFGYSAAEVLGKNVNILMPSPYHENHDTYLENYLRTGNAKIIGIGREVSGKRKDGSTFPLYIAVSEVRFGDTRLFSGILRDISEHKRVVDELRQIARFPEESPEPILRVSRDGRLLYANESSRRLLSFWDRKVGQDLPSPLLEVVTEAFSSGLHKEIEIDCGKNVYLLVLTPITNADDINIYGMDITHRKKAEEALRQSEQKYRALVESSSDAILLVDRDRNIISYNRAFLNLFGFGWKDVVGRSTTIIHPSEQSFNDFAAKACHTAEEKGSISTEWRLRKKDGTVFPVEETFSAVRDPDGSVLGFVAVIRDISERKRVEKELEAYRDRLEEMIIEKVQELQEANKALLHREKLKTLGAISAELAHEIRNPIMSIGGFSKRLKEKCPSGTEIEIILNQSGRLEKMLDRITNYLKPVDMPPQECSLNDIILESLELLSGEMDGKGVVTELLLASTLSPAYVDAGILIQVFINVIRNSMKVMQKDGRITIGSYETEQNVHAYVKTPVGSTSIQDPEHVFLPFMEDEKAVSTPICFRLLRDMGGLLSFKHEDDGILFSAALLKSFGAEVHDRVESREL